MVMVCHGMSWYVMVCHGSVWWNSYVFFELDFGGNCRVRDEVCFEKPPEAWKMSILSLIPIWHWG